MLFGAIRQKRRAKKVLKQSAENARVRSAEEIIQQSIKARKMSLSAGRTDHYRDEFYHRGYADALKWVLNGNRR